MGKKKKKRVKEKSLFPVKQAESIAKKKPETIKKLKKSSSGQLNIKETKVEKEFDIFFIILIILAVIIFAYLIYRFVKNGQIGEAFRFFLR